MVLNIGTPGHGPETGRDSTLGGNGVQVPLTDAGCTGRSGGVYFTPP